MAEVAAPVGSETVPEMLLMLFVAPVSCTAKVPALVTAMVELLNATVPLTGTTVPLATPWMLITPPAGVPATPAPATMNGAAVKPSSAPDELRTFIMKAR